jgi:CubicO group peptidase (beta-lactamase class C family)
VFFRTLTLALIAATALTACGGGDSTAAADTALQRAADHAVRNGLAGVAISHLGTTETTHAHAGLRRLGSTDPLRADDSFMIGSTTKAMTSALAARLVERGAIAWTTSMANALPELAELLLPAYRSVTLEQLLAHRGGVRALDGDDYAARLVSFLAEREDSLPTTTAGRLRLFAVWALTQEPAARPGQDFLYSNVGYALVALMLEAATGQPYADLMARELAQPLGLQLSWTSANTSLTHRPAGHAGAKGRLAPVQPEDPELAAWLDLLAPAGGGTTMSPAQFSHWVRWHLRALRGEAPLPDGYVRRLRTLNTGEYALGWVGSEVDGRPVLAHDGGWRGFTSLVILDQRGRSASAAFTNTGDTDWVAPLLNPTVLDLERARPPAP